MESNKDTSERLSGKGIDDLVQKTIIGKLKMVLGEEAAKIIHVYAAKSYPKGEEGPEKVKVLIGAIRSIFGFASSPIERLVLKNLYSLLGIKYEEKEGYDILDYVTELRNRGSMGKGGQK
ncbi:MAG: hypothetical protein KIH08_05010 [Candidatus Freyarchaeota archaeon]|nr:hypothetical protein [Candidatus Jordarchaeia archaeon]MBS7268600.1 hypothetical protein [Candidatus Jordarchaeia archaeon]MBS7279289.1 hypothetical protein [Candidatus Jordarchaeia archaeon]